MRFAVAILLFQVTPIGGGSAATQASQAQALLEALRQPGLANTVLGTPAFSAVQPFPDMKAAVSMIAAAHSIRPDGSLKRQAVFSIRRVSSAFPPDIEIVKAAAGAPESIRDEVRDPDATPEKRVVDKVHWYGIVGLGIGPHQEGGPPGGLGHPHVEWLYVKLPGTTRSK